MSKKRILFGAVDIGYRIELYSKFIKENYNNELIAESFSKYVLPKEHYKTNYTYTCEIYNRSKLYVYFYLFSFFVFALFRYDIFHFLSGETILTRKLRTFELFIYKLLGKRVIMHFVGADIRSGKFLEWKNNNIVKYLANNLEGCPPLTEPWQDKLIKDSLKYADEIIVSTPDLLDIIPSAKYYPVVIDYKKFLKETGEINILSKQYDNVLLHCPSNRQVKGTYIIENNLLEVKKKIKNLDIVLPHKNNNNKYYAISRYQLMELYKKSNIVIDQLIIGWYGLQSIEALLTGNYVFCFIDEKYIKYLYPKCPLININAENMIDKIIDFLNNENKINSEKYQEYLTWVLKYHTIENNNQTLLQAWTLK